MDQRIEKVRFKFLTTVSMKMTVFWDALMMK
jgi:hypothetical protein